MAKKYIDADWLLDVVENIIEWDTERDRNRIIHQVRELTPTADVRENVRGKWINKNEGMWNTLPIYKCSVCGDYDSRYSNTDNVCPNCGADMRQADAD